MSATDSDNSIDWLASDYEDNESEQEFDSDGKCGQVGAPLSPPERPHLEPPDGSRQVKDCQSPWSQAEEASSRGSPPSCVEEWDGDSGLCKRQQSEKPPPQQALKRPRSSVGEERRERQLLPNESEKSQTFSHKVRAPRRLIWFPAGAESNRVCRLTPIATLAAFAQHADFQERPCLLQPQQN